MKVALVTGAARRLGRALALDAAEQGYAVAVHYRGSEKAATEVVEQIVSRGGTAVALQADLSDDGGGELLAERVRGSFERIDLIINNVGIYELGDSLELSPQSFERTLRANLVAPHALTTGLVEHFAEDGGSVVNIGYSGLAALGAAAESMAYTISKTGLLIWTRTLAERLGPRGIRVNMVSPGQLANSVDLPDDFGTRVPLRRPGHLADVVGAVRYLCSKEAAYVTGQNLEVAGGYMLRLEK